MNGMRSNEFEDCRLMFRDGIAAVMNGRIGYHIRLDKGLATLYFGNT